MVETRRDGMPGIVILVLGIILFIINILVFITSIIMAEDLWPLIPLTVIVGIIIVGSMIGLFMVDPNEGKVFQLFGAYRGTARQPGLRWTNPFYSKNGISLRVRNFETGRIKVNDRRGNPIEIAAVVVWRVVDTYEAAFEVDDFENYVHIQSEAAVRNLATAYAYDATDDELTLTANTAEVSQQLNTEIQERLEKAGVEVQEARISHLAYAPEIAAAMLRRQQAYAVVDARKTIVEGAVGMVQDALDMLSDRQIMSLEDEHRSTLVSNLLVVLTSENSVQPVVNTAVGPGQS